VKTKTQLTKEQQQYLADMMAEMLQENAAQKPTSKKLALSLTATGTRSFRLPIAMLKNIDAFTQELNATQGYVFWHLYCHSISGIRTAEYLEIAKTKAFKSLREKMKDESCLTLFKVQQTQADLGTD